MFEHIAFYRPLALTALLVAAVSLGLPTPVSHAQSSGARKAPPARVAPRDSVLGGYSTTLSEVWGVPEMPPAPTDFGPHFDYPGGGSESLNGPPDHSPYPN
jgi:hypothetical protein